MAAEDNKCKMFGELEAIYNNQTGSGSALTGENVGKNVIENVEIVTGAENGSENSISEEKMKKKRRSKDKEKITTMVGFFENVVKQVIDHQEVLHNKFIQVVEKMDKERTEREEAWRRDQAIKRNREAIARAHEQKLSSNREALIISHMEKIIGRRIELPERKTPVLTEVKSVDSNNRWPKAEVEALIQVRTGLESRFVEPGLKGPLWDEVSSVMGSMGYRRSAKRCKEKWENINKYFKKTKESGKKRSSSSKTCAYFQQLDQLYSVNVASPPSSSEHCHGYMELLSEGFGGIVGDDRYELDED